MGAAEEDCESSHFVRVCVRIDITKPLCRGRKIGLSNGEEGWVSFNYELLPNLCYWCGRLTYYDKDCSIWLLRKGSMQGSDQQFSSWLQAKTANLAKKTVIRVTGYEEVIHGDDGPTLHSEQSEGEDVKALNSMQSNGIITHHCGDNVEGGSAKSDTVHGKGEVLVATDGDESPVVSIPNRCMDQGHLQGTTSQNFQDQLDEINAEIKRFDGGKELEQQNRVCRSNGEGDRIEKSLGRLTNYALQLDVGSTPSIILGELCSLKHPREVSSEELGLANDSREKQALVIKTQSVEADVQPCRHP